VANAVFEQADAIMLSGETSTGRYPVECVEVFDRVARRIERSGGAGYGQDAVLEDARQKTCAAAVVLANSLQRASLVVFTHHGTMARYVSKLRPENAPIFAFTPNEEILSQIVICWGVHPVLLKFEDDPHSTIETAVKYLCENKLTHRGDNLIVLSDMLGGRDKVDSVQLRTAE
jgi:pyruvate kinase